MTGSNSKKDRQREDNDTLLEEIKQDNKQLKNKNQKLKSNSLVSKLLTKPASPIPLYISGLGEQTAIYSNGLKGNVISALSQ